MRLIATAIALLLMLAGPAAAEQFALIHGNWCGFRNKEGPGDSGLPPVDALDAICMRHDQCYDIPDVDRCSCDLELMSEVEGLDWAKGRSTRLARTVFYGIALKPCTDRTALLRKVDMARSSEM
jgi:hypothetical protein